MTLDILAPRQQPLLARFARGSVLLAFDYDGTLAPIASSPEIVRMRVRTRRLLTEVALRYPVIAISGRPLADLAARLDGIPLRALFGNYGAEPVGRHVKPPTELWAAHLQRHLLEHPGVVVEDKQYSVTVHYRHARHRTQAHDDAVAAARTLHGVRLLGGVQAVTILPAHGTNKGATLQRIRRSLACDTALYAGDDDTDEDAFRSDTASRLLAIRMGASDATAAGYHLDRQTDIDRLLQALIALRAAPA
ncbi:MAG: trehalose-phosphatase [Vicinamibacterales bacterium]